MVNARWLLSALSLFILLGCDRSDRVESLTGYAQGTTWNIRFWREGGADPTLVRSQVVSEFQRLDMVMSNYRPDSTIEGFNSGPAGEPVVVGSEIVTLVQAARGISEASKGCYDLTVKPLFELWGFRGEKLTPPSEQALAQTLSRVGFEKIEALPPDQLRKQAQDVHLDLSSIAQGYSVARIAQVLEAAGIHNYMVEIGGEMQVRGEKPDGAQWRIAVESPVPGERTVQRILTIGKGEPVAIMTSGTYRHYFDDNQTRYSHVIDARTGTPVTHDTVSVTVVSDNPTLADAWSTALLCLGRDEGQQVAEQAGVATLFIVAEGDDYKEYATRHWQNLTTVAVE